MPFTNTDKATNGFYVIMFTSESYTLQDNTTIYRKIITAGESVIKAQHRCYMQVDTNWYWNQHPQLHFITVPTRTILHPKLGFNSVIGFHVYTRAQAKNTYQDILYV